MEELKLSIKKQSISCDRTSLVSDTKNVYECVFDFDEEWEGYTRWAVFKQDNQVYKVLIENDRCLMPQEAVAKDGYCYIGVYGLKDDKRYPTIWTIPPILVLLGCIDGVYPPIPTPSEWEQALEYMAKIDTVEQDVEDLENNKVDKDGDKVLTDVNFSQQDKTKLDDLENYDDTDIKQDILDLQNNKVNKDGNKVLSDNNFTTDERNKLASLENYDDSQLRTLIGNLQTEINNLKSLLGEVPNGYDFLIVKKGQ